MGRAGLREGPTTSPPLRLMGEALPVLWPRQAIGLMKAECVITNTGSSWPCEGRGHLCEGRGHLSEGWRGELR